MSDCTCPRTDGYRIKRRGCPAHAEKDAAYWQQCDDRKYGTDSPHEPSDEFVVHAFAEGARYLWPDSRDPGWHVTFRRWLDGHTQVERGAALEMSQKAEQAELRAEEAEFHVEQLRDARDSAERKVERAERLLDGWEHDGPDDPAINLLICRVREALDGAEVTNGCQHEWLDRPESDSRECLICGTEVSGS